jgi:hypothetical protein
MPSGADLPGISLIQWSRVDATGAGTALAECVQGSTKSQGVESEEHVLTITPHHGAVHAQRRRPIFLGTVPNGGHLALTRVLAP